MGVYKAFEHVHTQRNSIVCKTFSLFISIVLVIGLMPSLGMAQAYASDGISPQADEVASVTIGGATTTYDDFSQALSAANAGTSSAPATLTLLADVDMGDTEGEIYGYMTLDLAGYTLTGDAYSMLTVGSGVEFTIEDTSAAGTGTITSTTCGAVVLSNGSLIVNSGTITTPCVSFSENGTASRSVWEYAPIRSAYTTVATHTTINGGTIESASIYDDESGETIDGGMAIDITSYANGTSLTITGGTITGGSGWFGSRSVISTGNGNYTNPANYAPTITITGGVITASNTSKNAIELTAYSNTTIGTAGTGTITEPRVSGGVYSNATSSYGVYPAVYSGLYTQQVAANYIPNGYECIEYTEVEGYSYLVRHEPGEMYDVNIGTFSHGSISADATRAEENQVVTLTVTPDLDYRLAADSLTVTYIDPSGQNATITPEGADNTYTFVMPAANVTVSATFEEAPLWEGSGTESDPYLIGTADDLNTLARKVNTGTRYTYTYFEVTDDITIDDGWIAIGYSQDNRFSGTFDGGMHVITLNGVYTDDGSYRTHISETYGVSYYNISYLGLFGYFDYTNTTSNLPTVKNVIVEGTLESYDTTYGMYVGGIVGRLYGGRIVNCENRAEIAAWGNSSGDYAGGITGDVYSTFTDVINVYNSGNVTAGQQGGSVNRAGGITGNLNPSNVRVSNAVISEDCVITQNGSVRDPASVDRLFGYYSTSSRAYENAYDRAVMSAGDVTQADLDEWNAMSLDYAPDVLTFWVLDGLEKPIPRAAPQAEAYNITVVSVEGGTIEVDRETSVAGGTVTVTVTPDDGYEFESITVSRDDGEGDVETTPIDDGVYEFTMPDSDVTVSATFTLAPEPPVPTPTIFTVTFDTQSGTEIADQEVEEGQCATQPDDPTREGYMFTGWFTDSECTDAFDFSTPIERDLTLYAGWEAEASPEPEPTIFTVTFDTQGGTVIADQEVEEGQCATQPPDPTREGYTFTGWFINSECTIAFNFDTAIIDNLTLYAGWKAEVSPTPEPDPTPTPDPEPTTIDAAMFTVDTTDATYTGFPIEKEITSDLTLGVDYEVTYTDNINAGEATITITGIGDYTGSLTYTFTINRAFTRLAGEDRYGTMEAEDDEGFETADVVVLTAGANFPDALSAAGFAGTLGAPVVLTTTDELSAEAAEEIARLGASKVYIVGGTASVSAAVERALIASGVAVTRVSGEDRYATAVATYRAAAGDWGNTAIIAAGTNFADTLSSSSYAWWADAPIFLSGANGLDDATKAAIESGGFDRLIIVGGVNSVPASVEAWAQSVVHTKRLAGDDRYGTSVAFATWAYDEGMSFNDAGIATGKTFPDALAGGALAGQRGAVILLADIDGGTQAVDLLAEYKDEISRVYYLGGVNSVTPELTALIESALS